MAATIEITVTNAGGNIVLDGSTFPQEVVIEVYAASNVILANNFHLEITPAPADGTIVNYLLALNTPFDLNGFTFDIDSVFFTQDLIDVGYPYFGRKYYMPNLGGIVWSGDSLFYGYLNPTLLPNEGVTLTKIEDLARGFIIRGDSSNRPVAFDANGNGAILIGDGTDLNSVVPSGDVTITNAGVTAIGAGVIVNADVNASAAITRTKLASGTGDYVVINDAAGAMSQEAQLSPVRGGLGADLSSSTGFVTMAAGSTTVAALTDVIVTDVSFEAAGGTVPSVGDFKITMPFACTVTGFYAYATKAFSATDNGTIVPKNNAGTTMSGGTITFTASDARGTAYTSTPTNNNTFAAGEILTLTTAKTTAGGWAKVSISYTRNS